MQQKISKTECGFVVTDIVENLNPSLIKKAENNNNGLVQFLEMEGVELRFDQEVSKNSDSANIASICTKFFEKDSLTNKDLEQVHESHDRILETISMWSLKRQSKIKSLDPTPQKEATPYELWCEFLNDEKRDTMDAKGVKRIFTKALGYEPSFLVLHLITQQMTREYERSKENQKKL